MSGFKRKLLIASGVTLAAVVAAELVLRTRVPSCGVTPFRNSDVPGLMAELKPSFETLYRGHVVRINSSGFRGPEVPEPRDGALRVALVGDSYTFGSAVAFEDTLGARLESRLRELGADADVINMGVPGYATEDAAAVVEERALEYSPDVVVYVFFANDVYPQLAPREIPEDAVIDGMYGYPLGSALAQWSIVMVKRVGLAAGVQLGSKKAEDWDAVYDGGGGQRVRDGMVRMRDACAAADVRFVVAVYPMLTRLDLSPTRTVERRVVADARGLGLEVVELVDAYGGAPDLTRYRASVFDSHPSGEGHGLAAALLADVLAAP